MENRIARVVDHFMNHPDELVAVLLSRSELLYLNKVEKAAFKRIFSMKQADLLKGGEKNE
ncbi:hypothetical protein [Metabacillus arenae]|uniref:Uncharacterized protein n=1 Tax=Metabacillus arenae TaxID=2771434 RepID=A0A926RZT8_9BACI|nr:hypothetical protein [Metabacillus arenae]MBD1382592.1 hypothetical protein [Metabacillus arenae]